MKRVDIFSKKYYTDWHDVDEDRATIADYGGYWGNADSGRAGMFKRDMFYTITSLQDHVASSNTQNVKLYGFSRCRRRYED